jgi:polyisoprenoid-binding protein YceI
MSLKINQLAAFLMVGLAFFACKNDASQKMTSKADPNKKPAISDMSKENVMADSSAGKAFNVTNSTVFWTGTAEVGKAHMGTINASSGTIRVANGKIVGGEINLDLKSLAVTDLTGEEKADLEKHLKATDFFEVAKFPTGKFKINEIMPGRDQNFNTILSGDLTLKGVTKNVNIPANVKIEGGKLTATTPTFSINRVDFGIKYASSLVEKVKDKIIKDAVLLRIELNAAE